MPPAVLKLALAAANSVRTLCAAACVSRAWRQVTREPSLWRVLDVKMIDLKLASLLTVPRLKFLLSTGGVEELYLDRGRAPLLTAHDVADALKGAPPLRVLRVHGLKAGQRLDKTGSRVDPIRRLRARQRRPDGADVRTAALSPLDVRGTCVLGDCERLCGKKERRCAPCKVFCCDSCVEKCRPEDATLTCGHICSECWELPETDLISCKGCESGGICSDCFPLGSCGGCDTNAYCSDCTELCPGCILDYCPECMPGKCDLCSAKHCRACQHHKLYACQGHEYDTYGICRECLVKACDFCDALYCENCVDEYTELCIHCESARGCVGGGCKCDCRETRAKEAEENEREVELAREREARQAELVSELQAGAQEARERLDEAKQQVEPVAKRAEAAEARLHDSLANATVAAAAAAQHQANLTAEAEAAKAEAERLRASLTAEVEAAKAEAARLQARVAELEQEARNEARGKRNAVVHMEGVVQVKREQAARAVAASARAAAALDTATACAICMDKPRQMAVMPCNHLVLCQSCSANMMQHADDAQGIAARRKKTQPTPPCPICRTPVTGITGPYILS